MAWSAADILILEAAIASGVLEVEYAGPPKRRVEYQSAAAMLRVLAMMRREVGGTRTRRLAEHRKGFRE